VSKEFFGPVEKIYLDKMVSIGIFRTGASRASVASPYVKIVRVAGVESFGDDFGIWEV
jgi:hypothetical protein